MSQPDPSSMSSQSQSSMSLGSQPMSLEQDQRGNPRKRRHGDEETASPSRLRSFSAPLFQSKERTTVSCLQATCSQRRSFSSQSYQATSISCLYPGPNRWHIRARVINKLDIKTFRTLTGQGRMFSLYLKDGSGEIRAVAFDEDVDRFFNCFEQNKVYNISGGIVQRAYNRRYTKSDWEIILQSNSLIKLCTEDEDLPHVQFRFVPIREIENLQTDEVIDVIGVLHSAEDITPVKLKKDGSEVLMRDVRIVDQSGAAVCLTVWRQDVYRLNGDAHPVIAVKGVKVTSFKGRSLSMLPSSILAVDPGSREAQDLRSWYSGNHDSVFENISSSVPSSQSVHSEQPMSQSPGDQQSQVFSDASLSQSSSQTTVHSQLTPQNYKKDSKSSATEIYKEQDTFLRAIHDQFVEKVQPIEQGLVDDLRRCGAITMDEEEEMTKCPTAKDRARKLLIILHRMHPKMFWKQCLGVLKKRYSHVVNAVKLEDLHADATPDCLHCIIHRRVTVKRFADVLISSSCCSITDYECLIQNRGEENWRLVFSLMQKNSENEALIKKLQEMLQNIGAEHVYNPALLKEELKKCIPCRCVKKQKRDEGSSQHPTVSNLPGNATAASQRPPRRSETSTQGQHSSGEERNNNGHVAEEAPGIESFKTKAEKDKVLEGHENISLALQAVFEIRKYNMQLEQIREQLTVMRASVDPPSQVSCDPCPSTATHDPSGSVEPSTQLSGSLNRFKWVNTEHCVLEGRARNTRLNLDVSMQQLQKMLQAVEQYKNDANFSSSYMKSLLSKIQILQKEMKEAKILFENSKELFKEIVQISNHMQSH